MNNEETEAPSDQVPMEVTREDKGAAGEKTENIADVNVSVNVSQNASEKDDDFEDDDSRADALLRFKVANISKLKEKDQALSDAVMVRNLPWRTLIMHRGNPQGQHTLGFFLQCNAESDSSSWSVNATAELRLIHPNDESATISRRISHLFYPKENDWGYSHFIQWEMLAQKGFVGTDDCIVTEVRVQADAPHGVSWDSKKYTGYVGLKNQGATCYMNSLLQTLFFTNKLRQAVYLMPTESDDPSKSVPLAMQRVNYDLQFSDRPVGTKKLTKSFGWETLDSFMQHDVQELSRVLLDNMENKMKGTVVDGVIPNLFKGKMESYIKCKKVKYTSSREEPFYDIQLNVKGVKDLLTSFKEYTSVETLDGDNKYDAGELGMQEAEKGVRFISFPPVLHLQLMRFQYDPLTDSNIKINDRFEFPDELCLDEFLAEPESTAARYKLHSVLVHAGDNHGGHYVAYISPNCNGKWYRFDDDVVAKCHKLEAINSNFGGSDDDISVRYCTNAYMLVYIRRSHMDEVLCDVTADDIPHAQHQRFKEERRLDQQRRKERSEAHLYMFISCLTSDHFDNNRGAELINQELAEPINVRVKKSATLQEATDIVADHLGYPHKSIRLWPMIMRQNDTHRPNAPNLERTKFICDMAGHQSQVWNVWVETPPAEDPERPLCKFDSDSDVLFFLKRYCPRRNRLDYCGHVIMNIHARVSDLLPVMNQRGGLPKGTDLIVYEEVRPWQVEIISRHDVKIGEMGDEVMDGDIMIFQVKEDLSRYELPTPKDYLRDLFHRIPVQFQDKSEPHDAGFVLELSQKNTYEQMARAVAKHLKCNHTLLQFFKVSMYKDVPGHAIRCRFEGYIKDLFATYNKRSLRKLYYQKLSMPIGELENKRQVRCLFVSQNLQEEKEIILYPDRGSNIEALIKEAKKLLQPDGIKLRVLEVLGHRIHSVLSNSAAIPEVLGNTRTLRIEEIPSDQLNLPEDEMLVPCGHYTKDSYQAFGTPFLIRIKEGEKFSSVRTRIQKLLDVPDKDFKLYKFNMMGFNSVTSLFDEESSEPHDPSLSLDDFQQKLSGSMVTPRPWIGIDHINRAAGKRAQRSNNYFEKAIKIHN